MFATIRNLSSTQIYTAISQMFGDVNVPSLQALFKKVFTTISITYLVYVVV